MNKNIDDIYYINIAGDDIPPIYYTIKVNKDLEAMVNIKFVNDCYPNTTIKLDPNNPNEIIEMSFNKVKLDGELDREFLDKIDKILKKINIRKKDNYKLYYDNIEYENTIEYEIILGIALSIYEIVQLKSEEDTGEFIQEYIYNVAISRLDQIIDFLKEESSK